MADKEGLGFFLKFKLLQVESDVVSQSFENSLLKKITVRQQFLN